MKFFSIILFSILACVLVTGCEDPVYDREGRRVYKSLKKGESSMDMLQFKYIVVDDHEYLVLDGSKYMKGITHSPKCGCRRD